MLICQSPSGLTSFCFVYLFVSYLQFVSPSHLSHIYSEKLVHVPNCYFVNDYKQVGFVTFEDFFLLIYWDL